MHGFDGFEAAGHVVGGTRVFARIGGRADAPPLLLLHGFPQTHVMWRRVAQRLAPHFRLVLPDLRGYGESDKPPGGDDHAEYSKRAMAADMAWLDALAWATSATSWPGTTAARAWRTGWRWTTRARCSGWR